MFELFMASLNNWNATKSERQKLQHSYLLLTILVVLIAGVASLFNARVGHDVVELAGIALAAFVVNGLVWNLLQSIFLDKLATKPKRTR